MAAKAKRFKTAWACPHTDRKHCARGMCKPCYGAERYQQQQGHKPPWSPAYGGTSTCHPDQPHFALGKCRQCYMESDHKKSISRRAYLKRKYGLSPDELDIMYHDQCGACAICQTSHAQSDLHIDHCHNTGRVRALLCPACNQSLGKFNDDPARLRSAAAYLERTRHEATSTMPPRSPALRS